MLEKIREGSQGVWAMGILGLVILSFMFAGVGSYINSSGAAVAANVNGEEITLEELEKAYQDDRARMEQQYGDAFATLASDAAYLQNFRQGILDRLIAEKLMDQAAADLGLRVSDEQVKKAIVNMREFQIDGKFNNERYLTLLRQVGFQPNNFRDYMRIDMVRRQLSQSLLGSEFALDSEAKSAHMMQQQTRDLRYLNVSSAKFNEKVEINDEQINTYYQANITQFDTEEKVSLAYVELTLEDLLPEITISESELNDYYQQNLDIYRTAEERQASHILFESAEEDESVLAKAQEVLARAQAGDDFAELAKEFSSDTFSAENGGDLGFFGKGIMDPAFEESAYALAAKGDVSEVVKSSFGYHIIKLTDIKAEEVTAFEDVLDEVTIKVKTQKAEEEFYGIQERIAEVAFEVPDSLEEVAAEANKPVVTTELFTRNAPEQAVSNPKILVSAFSEELIEEAVNSEVIELGDNHIMVVRVAQHEAERTKALDEVTEQVKTILIAEGAQQAARDWVSDVQTGLNNEEDISAKLESLTVAWEDKQAVTRNDGGVSRTIVEAGFKLAENQSEIVDLVTGDVSLVQVLKINTAEEADSTQLTSIQTQLASAKTQNLYGTVVESLKAQASIEIFQ
ncbi:SurA N-terminal domain-containing protein [Paraglaciecola sp.]|uniref:SurA N-terminal domain-containing protein n=1 Tax=Paraglaciecola sp. TaxID=1920173 RepID=UPI003EF78D79